MASRTVACALSFILATTLAAGAGENPEEILARTKQAAGGDAWDGVRTVHLRARIETAGLSGPGESFEELSTGRVLTSFQLGPLAGSEGFDGKTSWSKDASGQVAITEDAEGLEGAANAAYLRSLAYWYPERHAAKVEAMGERAEGGRTFHVLRIHPAGGRPLEMWFDAASSLLDRVVETVGRETRTSFYSDYRQVSRLLLPFHSRQTNGDAKYDVVVRVESIELNPPIDEAQFAPPRQRLDDFRIAGGAASTTIPFELLNNHIYVDVQLNGKGSYKAIFDTGGMNVITPATANRLGVVSEGALQARGVGEKSEDAGIAKAAELRLGEAVINDQQMFVFPLQEMDKVEGFEFGGIVGYEILKRFVARIDYAASRLTLLRPEAFTPPSGAVAVPFTFREHMPQVEGTIDGIPGKFTIDTGSRSSLDLHGPFAERNGLKEKYAPKLEAVTGWGVGGPLRSAVARAGILDLGGVKIDRPVARMALASKGAFADPYVAGNVGSGLLRRFTVTFDYGKQILYLEPNANRDEPILTTAPGCGSISERAVSRSRTWCRRAPPRKPACASATRSWPWTAAAHGTCR